MRLGETDRVAAEAKFNLPPPSEASVSAVRSQQFEFKFDELPPGEYDLRFEFERSDGTAGRTKTPPIIVVEESSRERDLLWVDLRWLVRTTDKTAAVSAPRATPRVEDKKRSGSRRKGSRIIARKP